MLKRSRLLALLALLAVGLLAACGGDDSSDGGGGSGGDKSEDPAALLEKAFKTDVKSGELSMKVNVDVQGSGRMSGPVSLTLDGPFETRGKKDLPLLDWDISASGAGQSLSGGVVTTEDNAFVKFRGQTYEVGKRLYEQFLRQNRQQSESGPQSLGELGIDPADWLEDAKVSDGESVDGDATRKVSGKVNVEKVVDDFLEAAENPAIKKQLEGTGRSIPDVSDSDKQKVVNAIQDATLAVNVDEDDVARKVTFGASFKAPEGSDDEVTGGKLDFEYELSKVGEDVEITAPSDAKPLSLLLQQLGLGSGLPGGGLKTQ